MTTEVGQSPEGIALHNNKVQHARHNHQKNERFAACNINEVIIITCFWVAQTKNRKKIWYKYGPRCQWMFRRISNCCKYLSLRNILCMQWYVLVWYYVGKVMQSVHLWFTIAYIYHNFFVFPPIDPLISTDNFDFYICMMTTIVFEFGSQLTVTDKFVSYTSLVTGGFFYVYIHRLINWLKAIVHGEIMHKTMQYINQKHVWSKLSQI